MLKLEYYYYYTTSKYYYYIFFLSARPSKKLTFVYLANDVIQNSKKKGPEFAKNFETVLPDAFGNAAK